MELKLLSCPLCLKPHFHGVDSLRSSLISVATSHLACPVCNESLLGLDKLTIHLFSHMTNASVVPEHSTEDKSTEAHDEIAATVDNVAPGDEEASIKCDICNFNFTDNNLLEMHQKLLHQTIPDKITGLYSYHCHLCSKKFRKRGSLMVHLRVAHYGFGHHSPYLMENSIANGHDKDDMKNATPPNMSRLQDNKQWECDVCSKMFTTKYFLKKHKRLHTGEMPYFCAQCNKSFTFQQSYHKHMLYHSSEKPYMCNECGRAFKELSTLQNHARIHSGERPFGCETCGKKFRQRVSYLVHQRIHTGIMPYKCTACDKCFRYKVSQRSHKCPVNPPGSVVRIVETGAPKTDSSIKIDESKNNTNRCIMSVDYDTGTINFIQHETSNLGDSLANSTVQTSTPTSAETATVTRAPDFTNTDQSSNDGAQSIYAAGQPDLYSMVLSPLLPEVESLCLTGSPIDSTKVEDHSNDPYPDLFFDYGNK